MAWIESHQTLARHPKTMRASQALGISRVQMIGHLHMLWWWCLDYALDGALAGISDTEIAAAAEWEGDAEAFALALTRAGFLEADDTGTLHIHDWYEYAEKYIDRREANAQRMREARASKEKPRATHVQRTSPARAGATIPNQTIPNQTKEEDAPARGAPEYTAEFLAFFDAYPKHENKRAAFDYWRKVLRPDAALIATIMTAIERQKRGRKWIDGYANAPDVWLRGAKWEDEPEIPGNGRNGRAGQIDALTHTTVTGRLAGEGAKRIAAAERAAANGE